MKHLFFLLSLLLSLFIFAGCNTTYTLTPIKGVNSAAHYERGNQYLASTKENEVSMGLLSSDIKSKGRADFRVDIFNRSKKNIVFSTENIKAHYKDPQNSSMQLRVFTYEELLKEEKSRQMWAGIGAALAAGANSYSASMAGQQTTTWTPSTYQPRAFDFSGTPGGRIGDSIDASLLKTTYPQTTYNNAAVDAATRDAREENEKNLEKLNKQSELNIINLKNHILQKQTIRAGGRHGGIVKIKMPSFKENGQIVMEIKVGDEIHSLIFNAQIQQ